MMDEGTFKILSIDPGTTNTGYAVVEATIQTLQIVDAQAWSINAAKIIDASSWDSMGFGTRFSRVQALRNCFTQYLHHFRPLLVVSEAPFYNPKRPQAYGALLEVVLAFKDALYHYDRCMTLEFIEPSVAKKSIGVSGICSDKYLIRDTLVSTPELKNYNLKDLDEHASDALLVAKCQLDVLRRTYLNYTETP